MLLGWAFAGESARLCCCASVNIRKGPFLCRCGKHGCGETRGRRQGGWRRCRYLTLFGQIDPPAKRGASTQCHDVLLEPFTRCAENGEDDGVLSMVVRWTKSSRDKMRPYPSESISSSIQGVGNVLRELMALRFLKTYCTIIQKLPAFCDISTVGLKYSEVEYSMTTAARYWATTAQACLAKLGLGRCGQVVTGSESRRSPVMSRRCRASWSLRRTKHVW